MLWVPAPRVGEQVALLPPSEIALQITVVPSRKVTLPTLLGLPPIAVTLAVKVSASPYVLGLVPVDSARAVDVDLIVGAATVTAGCGAIFVSVPAFCFVFVVNS
jgi:hypothetical protein